MKVAFPTTTFVPFCCFAPFLTKQILFCIKKDPDSSRSEGWLIPSLRSGTRGDCLRPVRVAKHTVSVATHRVALCKSREASCIDNNLILYEDASTVRRKPVLCFQEVQYIQKVYVLSVNSSNLCNDSIVSSAFGFSCTRIATTGKAISLHSGSKYFFAAR